MADTLVTLKTRRSCRAYKPEPIEEEKLNAIIEAGTYAATGMGRQSPIIIAVTDRKMRDKLSKMNAAVMGSDRDPFYGAPELLIVLANRDIPTYLYDGSLVMGNMMNAAADLGVANCWIHRAKEEFDSEEGKKIGAKDGLRAIYCILHYGAHSACIPMQFLLYIFIGGFSAGRIFAELFQLADSFVCKGNLLS